MKYDLAIIGLGYIGLPAATIAAEAGLNVLGVDIRPDIVNTVNAGIPHIAETGLAPRLSAVVSAGKLRASLTPVASGVYMIAVPTPVNAITHKPDMAMVEDAARAVATVAEAGDMVILQSTSPVGATQNNVKKIIERARPDLQDRLDYIYAPERAIPGKTMAEMAGNDRAIGGLTPAATKRGIIFYARFVKGALLETDAATAEMVKLVENASRDAQIAFANELANVCDAMGLDVWQVIELANHHPRVNILQPGPGVGGHCLAVDPWFIIDAAPDSSPLMRAARMVNDARPDGVVAKIKTAAEKLDNPTICLLGLSYKENVDDFRNSPAIEIADKVIAEKLGRVLVVEPFMKQSDVYSLASLDEGIAQADIIVLLTAHDAFLKIPAASLLGKVLVDTRGKLRAA